jgi:hypothetical protein
VDAIRGGALGYMRRGAGTCMGSCSTAARLYGALPTLSQAARAARPPTIFTNSSHSPAPHKQQQAPCASYVCDLALAEAFNKEGHC